MGFTAIPPLNYLFTYIYVGGGETAAQPQVKAHNVQGVCLCGCMPIFISLSLKYIHGNCVYSLDKLCGVYVIVTLSIQQLGGTKTTLSKQAFYSP